MSLTMTATVRPSRFARMWFGSVVFPAPRKLESTVTGSSPSHRLAVGGDSQGVQQRQYLPAFHLVWDTASVLDEGVRALRNVLERPLVGRARDGSDLA